MLLPEPRVSQGGIGIVGIGQDREPAKTGDNLAQKFDAFASNIGGLARQPGDVTARSSQTSDHAGANRIGRRRKHDRDNRRGLLCGKDRWSVMRENDIDFQPNELGGELGGTFAASLRPAIFDRDGASFNPSEFAQSLHKSSGQLALPSWRSRPQESDDRHLARLLRARRERPRHRCAAECG